MRIRKRCPTATSAGGVQGLIHGLNIPPPPPHHYVTHEVYTNYLLENLRQWPRSEGAVAPAAATSSSKKDERFVSNCRSSTVNTATTPAAAAAITAVHDSASNISFVREHREALIRDLTGDARRSCSPTVAAGKAEASCVEMTNPNRSTAEAGNFIENAIEMMPCSDQEDRRLLSNRLLPKQAALSPSRFRPPTDDAAPLSQSKRIAGNKNAESEAGEIQRHMLSNWSMPSLKGLRRSRFYSPMHQPQIATAGSNNGNPYRACKKELVDPRSHRAPAEGDRSSSDDNTVLQDVQTWPKVAAVKLVAGPKLSSNQISGNKLLATLEQNKDASEGEPARKKMKKKKQLEKARVMLSCNYSRADNEGDDQNNTSNCSSDGPDCKLQLKVKSKFQIGQDHDEIIYDDGKQQESRGRSPHEDGSDNQHELGITMRQNNIRSSKHSAGISKMGIVHQERPSPTSTLTGGNNIKLQTAYHINTIASNSTCKLKKSDKTAAGGAAAESRNGTAGGNLNEEEADIEMLDFDQGAMKKKVQKKDSYITGGGAAAGGTSSRWRKKCRPVFRSINDIQRRAPLINNDEQGLPPPPPPALSHQDGDHRHQYDDRLAGVAAGDQEEEEEEDPTAQDASTNSSAATTSTDAYPSNNNPSKISRYLYIDGNKYRDSGNPILWKLNGHIKKHYLTAPDQGQLPAAISRPSKRRAAAAAIQSNIATSPPPHHDAVLQSLYRCSLNSDPFEWRPDYSHFV